MHGRGSEVKRSTFKEINGMMSVEPSIQKTERGKGQNDIKKDQRNRIREPS